MIIGQKELRELIEAESVGDVYNKYWRRDDQSPESDEYEEYFSRAVISNMNILELSKAGRISFTQVLRDLGESKIEITNILQQSGIDFFDKNTQAKINELEVLDLGELAEAVKGDPDLESTVGTINLLAIVSRTLTAIFKQLGSYSEGFEVLKKLDKIGPYADSALSLSACNAWIGNCFDRDGHLKEGRKLPTKETCAKILQEMMKRGVPVNAETYAIINHIFGDDKHQTSDLLNQNVTSEKLAYTVLNPHTFVQLLQVADDFDKCEEIYRTVVARKLPRNAQMFSLWLEHSSTPEQDTKVFENAVYSFKDETSPVFLSLYIEKAMQTPERFANAVRNLFRTKFLGKIFTLEMFNLVDFEPGQALATARELEKFFPDLKTGYANFASDPTSKQNIKKYSGEFGTLMKVYDYLLNLAWDLPESGYIAPTELANDTGTN